MNFIPIASSSKGNCYLVTSKGAAPLMIDAGIPIKRIRERLWKHGVALSDLAGCLLDHEHGDHSYAIDDLLRAGVDCYMSAGTADALGVGNHHRANMFHKATDGTYRGVDIGGQWVVLPFALEHDAEEPTGFLIGPYGYEYEELLFIPDTAFVRNKFKGITILAIECNFMPNILSENIQGGHLPAVVGHRTRRNHMSLDTVIGMLKANDLSRCRQIWLLHMSSGNSDEAKMIRAVQSATGVPTYAAQT